MPGMRDCEFRTLENDYMLGIFSDERKDKELIDELTCVTDWKQIGYKEELRNTIYNNLLAIMCNFGISVVIMTCYLLTRENGISIEKFLFIMFCVNASLTWIEFIVKFARLIFLYKNIE